METGRQNWRPFFFALYLVFGLLVFGSVLWTETIRCPLLIIP